MILLICKSFKNYANELIYNRNRLTENTLTATGGDGWGAGID